MAVDFFLKLDGIPGESKDKAHKGEIDVLAWSWGMSQSGTMHMGGEAAAVRPASRISASRLTMRSPRPS
jgi:type VI secretion system secreted protein Hcp